MGIQFFSKFFGKESAKDIINNYLVLNIYIFCGKSHYNFYSNMISPNTEESCLQENNLSKRSIVLENQIEQMLNKLMTDENDESSCINFCDADEEIEDDQSLEKELYNYQENLNNFQHNGDFSINNSQSTSPSLSFKRENKKYPTISFTSYPLLYPLSKSLGFGVPNGAYQNYPHKHRTTKNQYQKQNLNFDLKRSNNIKNTYEIRKNQNEYNLLTPQKNEHNSSSFSPNQIVSFQLEVLLYEISNSLLQADKIDFFIYSKLQGKFVKIIKTLKGSKIFQNYLKNTPGEIIHQIFMEIKPELINIMNDSYANYFCKRFYIYLNYNDRIDFLLAIQSSIIKLSLDSIGTYPIQSIVEQVCSKNEKMIFVNSIQNSIEEFCYDTYGTHVIEKILTHFEENYTSFIYDYVLSNLLPLAKNINGICVVKKVLIYSQKQEVHNRLKQFAYDNALDLIEHPYGNYVIQVILENWDEKEVEEILCKFNNKFAELSNKKYSSNVVERCLEKNPKILEKYIDEICSSGKVAEIMKNNYGNYVIQKALKISTDKNNRILADNVNKNIYKLNDKKLMSKWKNIVFPYLEKSYYY